MKQRQLNFIPSLVFGSFFPLIFLGAIEAKANGCLLFFVAPIALTSLIAAFALGLERMMFATEQKDKSAFSN